MSAILPRPTRLPEWRYVVRRAVVAVLLIAAFAAITEACSTVTGIRLCDDPTCNQLLPATD